jgi:uncharacterized membrane protein
MTIILLIIGYFVLTFVLAVVIGKTLARMGQYYPEVDE